MPFEFDHQAVCPGCTLGFCIEDRRDNPVRGRQTVFRLRQAAAMACTFDSFVPGTDSDPDSTRTFDDYLDRFRANAAAAAIQLFGDVGNITGPAMAKVEGDVFELIEAAALWNATAAWNVWMDTGQWTSTAFVRPQGVPTPYHKIAILKLPRGYDPTQLFEPGVRSRILAHQNALRLRGMELGLSSPDIVGVRIPVAEEGRFAACSTPITSLSYAQQEHLEHFYRAIEGTLAGSSFLFAIAVKRTTRSDRLYQPLFEANVLKYLVQEVLRGAAFRFHVHMGSMAGADVEGHYKAASLVSLLRGGDPSLAIDRTWLAISPRETAQMVLDELPLFPS